MEYSEQDRDNEIAMVHLGTHGSTTYPPQKWHGWAHAEEGYAPEWLTAEDLDGADPDDCVTVLDYSLSTPEAPDGWRLAYQYAAGEHDCPWCGDSYQGMDPPGPKREDCKLCEGDGVIYSGEECQVCVFAPITDDDAEAEAEETDDWLKFLATCPGAELVRDSDAPLLWSVVSGGADSDIIGAGATASEAITDAAKQVAEWEKNAETVG